MPSRELFVDTSAWYPIVVKRHPQHIPFATVLRARVASGERIVSTNLVLMETYALLVCRGHRPQALDFVRKVRHTPNEIVTSTAELELRAIDEWLDPYDDQDFSFADAVSFVVMRDRGITGALTLDHHFATAGFEMITGS